MDLAGAPPLAAGSTSDCADRETTSRTSAGPYSIDIPFSGGYDVSAILDANSDCEFDAGELPAFYPANPVDVTTSRQVIRGIDSSLGDTHAVGGVVRWTGGSPMSNVDVITIERDVVMIVFGDPDALASATEQGRPTTFLTCRSRASRCDGVE